MLNPEALEAAAQLRDRMFDPAQFAPTPDAPKGTRASFRLHKPVRLLGRATAGQPAELGRPYELLHLQECTGEHMEGLGVMEQAHIRDLFDMAASLSSTPREVFRRMHPHDVARLNMLLLGPLFLGESLPEPGAPT